MVNLRSQSQMHSQISLSDLNLRSHSQIALSDALSDLNLRCTSDLTLSAHRRLLMIQPLDYRGRM